MVKLLQNKNYDPVEYRRSQTNTSGLMSQPNRKRIKPRGFFLGVTTTSIQNDDDDEENIPNHQEIIDNTTLQTSKVDMNATDALGRTCIHHLVQPFPNGSYRNNIELLKWLHRSGASLTKTDLTGQSPLDYAALNGCQHLYNLLRELINEELMNPRKITIKPFQVNDPNKELLGLPDYYSDAQAFIDQYIVDHSSETVRPTYQVDPISNMTQTGEIVMDTDKNEPYDVRLTITDVDYGLIGLYNFYRMQMIKHKSKANLYLLLTRWGRIGEGDGQHQLTPFSSFEECRKEFCKIFRDKTGNAWENTNQFEYKPKKYTLIKLNERQMKNSTNVPIDFELLQDETQHRPSKVHSSSYKNFFKLFFNPQAIRSYLNKVQLDIEWMPVSQLKPETLQRARELLTELKTKIEEKEKMKLTIQQSTFLENSTETNPTIDPIQKDQLKLLLDSICKLTNEYYSIIPLQGYGYDRLPIIDSEQAVQAQEQKLEDIFELELSYKILLAAQANLNRISPLDYLYKSINCQFEAMNENDPDFQFILRYIWSTAANIQIEQIFKISRSNDDERLFQCNLDNHQLLWHGTNICNLISILTRGRNFFEG